MALHNYPSDAAGFTPGSPFNTNGPLNVGTNFAATSAANVTGVRYYSPSVQTVTAQLWLTGSKVAETTGFSCAIGWNTIPFTTPYTITTGTYYVASVLVASGSFDYTAVNGKFSSGGTPINVAVAQVFSNTTVNGQFTASTGFPNTNGADGTWYGVDAVFDDLVSGDASVSAVRATATATVNPPAVTGGSGSASVTAVRAQATAAAQIPSVDVTVTLSGGSAATASATANPPTVVGGNISTGLAVRATATAAARPPTVTGSTVVNGSVSAVVATASVLARPGTIVGGSVTSLPAAVTFGAVKGWLAQGVNQSPDADGFADLVADQGTVTFTPTKNVLLFPSASPAPLILTPKVVVATLDSDGYLIGTKTGGAEKLVRLIVGTYTVSYQLTGVTINPHAITITASTTTDLVEVMPT